MTSHREFYQEIKHGILNSIHVLDLVQIEEQPGCVRPKAFVDHSLLLVWLVSHSFQAPSHDGVIAWSLEAMNSHEPPSRLSSLCRYYGTHPRLHNGCSGTLHHDGPAVHWTYEDQLGSNCSVPNRTYSSNVEADSHSVPT